MFFSTSCNLGMNSRFNWLLSILKVTISLLIFSQLYFYRTIRSIPCCRAPTTGRGTPQSSRCGMRPAVASRELEAAVRRRGVVLASGAGAGAPLPHPARRPAPRSCWRLDGRREPGGERRQTAERRSRQWQPANVGLGAGAPLPQLASPQVALGGGRSGARLLPGGSRTGGRV